MFHAGDARTAAVRAFLSDPATHGLDTPVTVIETHAALVFLAGPIAYKIKKPVRFPFMDLSTLARREAACRREIEVNAAYAAPLYHGVTPITRDGEGHLHIGGTGPVMEWAVVMDRFDETRTLDRVAAGGPLPLPVIDALGDALAHAHAAAPIREPLAWIADLGCYIEQNDQAFRCEPGLYPPEERMVLTQQARAAFLRVRDLLAARGRLGRIRLLHGDCHLGNVALIDDRPVLFDAIEFDDAIATGDLLYDLAFLVMDLWTRGRKAEANRVFNRYLADSATPEDLKGLAALPLFLHVRAAIRSKIAAARARAYSGEEAEALRREASDGFHQAMRFLDPVTPRLLAIGGFSGTGKTTLAHLLAPDRGRAPGALILRSDLIRKKLAGVSPTTRLPESAYRREASAEVYDRMLSDAAKALSAGHDVILDAVFADPAEREAVEELGDRLEVPVAGLWLQAPTLLAAERVTTRTNDASDADASVVAFQAGLDPGQVFWARVDARGVPEVTARLARATLARRWMS